MPQSRAVLLALTVVACPAVAQQAPAPPPAPARSAPVVSAAPQSTTATRPLPPAYWAFGANRAGRARWDRGRPGIDYLPPNAVYYIESYQKAEQTGRCLVATAGDSDSASDFWAARPNSLPERRRLADWARQAQGCYTAGLHAPLPLLRGALAEARLQQTGFPPATAPSSARLTNFFQAEATRRRASDADDRAMSAFASCVAPLARTQVAALLATRHGSPEERRAMDRVLANGSFCFAGDPHLPAWGGTSFLRAYLAEAAYRWSRFDATAVASAG